MPVHEHFEELCALATIGQLSAQEHQELLAHLRRCERCKRTEDEFTLILDQLPAVDPPNVSGDTEELLSQSYRQRFLEKAAAAGIRFTAEVADSERQHVLRFSTFSKWRRALVIVTAICIVGTTLHLLLSLKAVREILHRSIEKSVSLPLNGTTPTDNTGRLNVPDSGRVVPQQSQEVGSPQPVTPDADSQRRLRFLQQQLAQAVQERENILGEVQRLNRQLALLKGHSEQSEEALSEASSEVQKLKNEQAQLTTNLVVSEAKNVELSEQIAIRESAIERERQLTAAAQDVRELMGSRNLHLIDVYDWDGRGKRDKSFGRVFFTEGKSLIFYAFDLPQKDEASKVTFQAWGQLEGGSARAKNLGVFHIDDHAQKRWVLRVDDPKLLASVDSVFVTVEPSPGRVKPSGKKLLYAYLGTLANHP
jgi:hypothetical protein